MVGFAITHGLELLLILSHIVVLLLQDLVQGLDRP
jgi:hypothetical protein